MKKTQIERKAKLDNIRRLVAKGVPLSFACGESGMSVQAFTRLDERERSAGLDGLADLQRTGRPAKCEVNDEEADYLCKLYLKSNSRKDMGSMTLAARMAAKDPTSPLRQEVRDAILGASKKSALPSSVKKAMRMSNAVVARYRDPKAGQNNGIFCPGFLRMEDDGNKPLVPGQREVWDDASVNVGVCVEWLRGKDPCVVKYGCRVARYQFLCVNDCATGFCKGYSYVMRNNDAYNASDVCAAIERSWRMNGYAPDEIVLEGGAWQAGRTLDMMKAAGVKVVSAKGRPNQKLIEQWFNNFWGVMSINLPAGQIGRFRGEMKKETQQWIACREGRDDPRKYFPTLPEFLNALDKSINYANNEKVESPQYGTWLPADEYSARKALGYGHKLESCLRAFALPVREVRKIFRDGMVKVTAQTPFGFNHEYNFAMKEGYLFNGAKVLISFDPTDIESGAVVELAERYQEYPKGHVIDPAAGCVSPAPIIWKGAEGLWMTGAKDSREEARMIKRGSRALIGAKAAAFDERGVKAKVAVDDKAQTAFSLGTAAPVIREEEQQDPDWAKLEREALFA